MVRGIDRLTSDMGWREQRRGREMQAEERGGGGAGESEA